ncbi:Copper amine oxidase [Paecilomyces lecythidis]|uniref:Copper amine oxidase n=1 Tax=Paecilomyces lecythidis TaxID=3004212 RepID=A0ABR3X4Y4_9EURO
MAGHFLKSQQGQLPPVPKAFRGEPQFSQFMAPVRFEGEITNLEIIGDVPKELSGTFYRVMPEPHFPSFIENDPWFNGDGVVSAFRVKDGYVDFKQKYVRTEKYLKEAEARRALLGKYRNKYTDAVEFQVRSTANTNIVYWNGKLLALKEDSPPYAMDPETLETIGLWDFDGQLPSVTFTAHPKFDPITREMVCFGYEAKGDGTPDVCYYSIDKDGKFLETVWTVCPVVGMIHDFAVTENYVVFPVIPLLCDVERMKKGGEHWQWENGIPMYIGVLPRRGAKGNDVKWFRAPHGFAGHVANAFETASGEIDLQLANTPQNMFFWWPDKDGVSPRPDEIEVNLLRYVIDPKSENLDLPLGETLVKDDLEFPRIDDRVCMSKHNIVFFDTMDRSKCDFPFVMSRAGGGHPLYNSLGMFNTTTNEYTKWHSGPRKMVQECIFIPRNEKAPEGDGFVMVLVNNYESMSSELAIIDTKNFEKEVALVKLPMRLRHGLHGNWVDDSDVDGHPGVLPK